MLVHYLVNDLEVLLLRLSEVRTLCLKLLELKSEGLISWHLDIGCSCVIGHLRVSLTPLHVGLICEGLSYRLGRVVLCTISSVQGLHEVLILLFRSLLLFRGAWIGVARCHLMVLVIFYNLRIA